MQIKNHGKMFEVNLGPVATYATLFLATYGAGTAGMQVAQVVVKTLKKP